MKPYTIQLKNVRLVERVRFCGSFTLLFAQQVPFGGTTLTGNFVVPADSYLIIRTFDGKVSRVGDKKLLAALDDQCEGIFI